MTITLPKAALLLALLLMLSGCVSEPQIKVNVLNVADTAFDGTMEIRFATTQGERLHETVRFHLEPHSDVQHPISSASLGSQQGNLTVTVSIVGGETATHSWKLTPPRGPEIDFVVNIEEGGGVGFSVGYPD
jgi:hypothetical protein